MSSLDSKSVRVLAVLYTIINAIYWIIEPMNITKGIIIFLEIITAFILLIAVMKNGLWSKMAWIWSAFMVPTALFQLVIIDYLTQFVVVKDLIIIGGVYFVFMPFLILVLRDHLFRVFGVLYN